MKISEALRTFEVAAPKDVDPEEIRELLLKAYKVCRKRGVGMKNKLLVTFGPKQSVKSQTISQAMNYGDEEIVISYNNLLSEGCTGIRIRVEKVTTQRPVAVLNMMVDLDKRLLKILTFDNKKKWQKHLMDIEV